MEWDIPDPVVRIDDLDPRLLTVLGRTGLLQVLIDHDTPGISQCPRCGWHASTSRRDCPSRLIAKALLERKPFPTWLVHLSDQVPGARRSETLQTRDQRRVAEDDLDGLFPAPARRPESRR